MTIIGLTGRQRSGKTTVADTLGRALGYRRLSFADPVRDAALALDPIVASVGDDYGIRQIRLSEIVKDYGWTDAKASFPEVRRTLRRLGTEVGRNLDPELWTGLWWQRARYAMPADIVVDDIRFLNEADTVRSFAEYADTYAVILRVERPGLEVDDSHASEREVDSIPVDGVIANDGSLDTLRARVVSFSYHLKEVERRETALHLASADYRLRERGGR